MKCKQQKSNVLTQQAQNNMQISLYWKTLKRNGSLRRRSTHTHKYLRAFETAKGKNGAAIRLYAVRYHETGDARQPLGKGMTVCPPPSLRRLRIEENENLNVGIYYLCRHFGAIRCLIICVKKTVRFKYVFGLHAEDFTVKFSFNNRK